jgi:hypothetical protein
MPTPTERVCHGVLILGPLFAMPAALGYLGHRTGKSLEDTIACIMIGVLGGVSIAGAAAGLIKTNNL